MSGTDPAEVVGIEGVTTDFPTAEQVGETGGSRHGIEAISDRGTIVRVERGGVCHQVTGTDLVWYTALTPRASTGRFRCSGSASAAPPEPGGAGRA